MSGKWRKVAAAACGAAGFGYLFLVVQLFFTGIDSFDLAGVSVKLRPWWKPLWIGTVFLLLMLWAMEQEPRLLMKARERLTRVLSRLGFGLDRPGSGWSLAGGFIFAVLAWFAASHFYYLLPSSAAAPLAAGLAVVAGAASHRLFHSASSRLLEAANRGQPPFRTSAGRAALYLIIWALLLTFPISHWEAMGTDPFFPLLIQALPVGAVLCWLILAPWGAAGRLGRVRRMATAAAAVAVIAAGIYSWRADVSRRQGPAPDRVLLITMDTTRADYLSSYGYPRETSPNLDALARAGVRFTGNFCPQGMTDPSHASVLTGAYPRTHGLRANYQSVTGQVGSLAAEFQDRGYYTATITSRAHLHPHIMNIPGFDDISAPSLSAQSTDAYDAYRRLRNLLLKHGDRDLFIWLHFFDPHSSYKFHRGYSETFVADYRGDLAPKTTISKGKTIDREEIEYARDLYAGEIYYMDHYIGRSVEAVRGIEPTPRREPFILLIADHGEALGDYIDREGHYAFGHGGVLYNASSRIPLIVVWPGMIPAKVVDDVAGSVDVAPTMLDYVLGYGGFKAQGRSLRAMIEGAAHEPSWTVSYRPRYREREGKFYATDQYAFIQGPYKYIRWDSGETELYDFMADPAEERDLSGEKPEIVDAYNRDLDQWFKDTPESKGDKRTLSKGEINVLKALGYIQ